MPKIYVAASSKEKARASCVMDRIRASPLLELAHDWVAVQDEVQAHGGPSDAELSRTDARGYATTDLEYVAEVDIFWLLAPETPTSGAWVEYGYALAGVSYVVVSGAVERSIFCACAHEEHATDAAAFKAIVGWEERHKRDEEDRQAQTPGGGE